MPNYTDIELTIEDPYAVVRLNRPEKLNAFTYHTLAEFKDAFDAVMDDPAVVGLIVTGTGRGFSSGLDSMSLAETVSDGGAGRAEASAAEALPGLFSYFMTAPKPVIAAVNGVAAGGGFVLAAKCDVRIASTGASFTTTFLKRGLIGEHGMTWVLPRLVGTGAAFDLLLTSRRIDATEALRLGLVDYVCEPEELLDRAKAYVREIAMNGAPQAIAETKQLLYAHMGGPYAESFREADAVQWRALKRPDAREGSQALLEKRMPSFERLGKR